MTFLRRISTGRLLALCGAVVATAAACAAIALAATGGGSVPPPKPLAQAVHDALAAPPVEGVTARIRFTNHLIDQGALGEGAQPLLTGASGRLWASRDGRLRIELQSDGWDGDSQVLVAGNRFSVYDAGSDTLYRGTLPQHREHAAHDGIPSVASIQRRLTDLMGHLDIGGAQPTDVAGRPAYTVRVTPRRHGGLVGAAELAWDAATGVPLRAALYAVGDADPVLELTATDISYGPVDGSAFTVTPAPGTKVVDLAPPHGHGADAKPIEGADAVQAKLPFKLAAPDTLAGRPRTLVRLVASDRHPAALVTYGRGLDGIAVIESRAGAHRPTREIDTALGTAIPFTRDGVGFVVIGSVPPATARAAAHGL